VITQVPDSTGANALLDLTRVDRTASGRCETATTSGCRAFPNDQQKGIQGVLRRLVLHLSIGEAF
jgi:hypothetical protein